MSDEPLFEQREEIRDGVPYIVYTSRTKPILFSNLPSKNKNMRLYRLYAVIPAMLCSIAFLFGAVCYVMDFHPFGLTSHAERQIVKISIIIEVLVLAFLLVTRPKRRYS